MPDFAGPPETPPPQASDFLADLLKHGTPELVGLLRKGVGTVATDRGLQMIAQAILVQAITDPPRALERGKALAEITRSRIEDASWLVVDSFARGLGIAAGVALDRLIPRIGL